MGLELLHQLMGGDLVEGFCEVQLDDVYILAAVSFCRQVLEELEQVCCIRMILHKSVLR